MSKSINKKCSERNVSPPRFWGLSESGQAMVEFVILLIFIMALCIGMCASVRLLTFQFWAQQEARFLAYEQSWVPHSFNSDPEGDPIQELSDGSSLRRPDIVSDREADRTVESGGSASNLLAANFYSDPIAGQGAASDETPVEYAAGYGGNLSKHPDIWHQRSGEWFAKVQSALEIIPTAFASQRDANSFKESPLEKVENSNSSEEDYELKPGGRKAAKALTRILSRGGFGRGFCRAIDREYERYPEAAILKTLRKPDCYASYEQAFAEHIIANIDIPDVFRDYGERIGSTSGLWQGSSISQGLEQAVRTEVANQFYSFFDQTVQAARSVAVIGLIGARIDIDLSLADTSVARMISDLRYIGSTAAIAAILAEAANVSLSDPTARNWQETLATEKDIVDILHTDAQDILPVINPFWLSPAYLPVPPAFGKSGVALQESVMKNVLFNESSLKQPLITEGSKSTEVRYQIAGGLFPAARKYIAGIEQGELAARHFLITEPWHIPRRVTPRGEYREKGTQEDTFNMDTDEGMLRRRVEGMWLFPSDFAALLEPISAVPGLSVLADVFQVLEPFGSIIGNLKHYILVENPFNQLANALSRIPVVGQFIPTLPQWPAVRPDAYPGSLELSGNESGTPDRLMGSDRSFQDYIEEQDRFNPPPNPTFHD